MRVLSGLLLLLIVVLGTPAAAVLPAASAVVSGAPAAGSDDVVHRVVWDDGDRRWRTRIKAADPDGAGKVTLWRHRRVVLVTEMSIDRTGRHVVFSPAFSRRKGGRLMLASTTQRGARNVLAEVRQHFLVVGGAAWSPDGRRIVFEGIVERRNDWEYGLWVVRRNGTGLHLLHVIPRKAFSDSSLAWTGRGVVYNGAKGLRLLRDGTSRMFVRGAIGARQSGNGRWLVFDAWRNGEGGIWRSRPNGQDLERIATAPEGEGLSLGAPSYDGRRILVRRTVDSEARAVVFRAAEGLTPDDPELDFIERFGEMAWN